MPEPKKPSVARLAVDTIKEAKEAGEEIGRMIQEINEADLFEGFLGSGI